MVTQDELARFLVDRGLAEARPGFGHSTGEAVAEELLRAFSIEGKAPAAEGESSPYRDQVREEFARELWGVLKTARPSLGDPLPYQNGFYDALTRFIGELESRTNFTL